jgi:putative peptide zinc metalloprotease protein
MGSAASATFSESWHRVADQRISLRPGVKVRRQNFRGERWHVLENPFTNQFFRLRPAAYEFVVRLRPDVTVEQAWQQCMERFPDEAPGQAAVIQLLSQLYFAGLLQYDLASDSAQLFDRLKKRRQQEIRQGFMNIMFMRFPLLDPDRFLVRTLSLVGKCISPLGAILWLLVVGFAVKVAVDNAPALFAQGQGVLAPANIFLLYSGMIFIKAVHEFGHAYFCRKFGGEVHVMGVMLMIFTPMPYVDATSSWGFRSRWQRVLVGAAGMITELFVAALAMFVWARTGEGIIHSLAYNMMFIASVSTIVFNLNPLLRFDGYYILSDFLQIPNLHQRSLAQLRHFFERYVFGLKKSEGPAQTRREAVWLAVFGVTSGIYRVIVFSGVLLFVADRFLIIGIVMAVVCLISWVTVPVVRFVRYLATNPRLDRHRPRAVLTCSGALAVLLVLLAIIPFPSHFRASGVVRTVERTQVANDTSGQVEQLLAKPAAWVVRGQPLLRMGNRELELELVQTRARLVEVDARLLQAGADETANIGPLTALRESVADRLKKLEDDAAKLVVRARHDGVWIASGIEEFIGRWLPKGSPLGLLANPASFEFSATVMQEDVDALFGGVIPDGEVRLFSAVGKVLPVSHLRAIPGEQRNLPSPALGWASGGDVPVALDDTRGNRAAEPFFEVIGRLPVAPEVVLMDGQSGKVRFNLPAEPLLPRWIRRLRQLIQKRYQM